jgi:hypothetical protein
MEQIESRRIGIMMLNRNRFALLPILVLAVVAAAFSGLNMLPLLGAFLGGVPLAWFYVWGCSNAAWWWGGIIGIWIGFAVGGPLLIFPNTDITPVTQLFVAALWVITGVPVTLFAFYGRFSDRLKGSI